MSQYELHLQLEAHLQVTRWSYLKLKIDLGRRELVWPYCAENHFS